MLHFLRKNTITHCRNRKAVALELFTLKEGLAKNTAQSFTSWMPLINTLKAADDAKAQ